MKKIIICLSSYLLLLTGCQSTQKVTLVLDYYPNTNHTGFYVALDQGYYEEVGIDLKIINGGNIPVETVVAQGEADFGISYQEQLQMARDKGLPVVSLATITQENLSGFVVDETSDIQEVEDFVNHTYCGWGTEIEQALVSEAVESVGQDASEVNFATTTVDYVNSASEECDIFWEYQHWNLIKADEYGMEYRFFASEDYLPSFYSPIIITSQTMIEEEYQVVEDFMAATIKGYEYAANNPDLAAEIFLKYNPEYDAEFILESQKFISPYYLDENGNFGYQDPSVYQEFGAFLEEENLIATNDWKEAMTNEFLD